ncbi:protein kinase domain-containing protein [Bremerella alba]|uniref:non-specific serine/threonine protein kinase n=1 Tax=Bremerella alba TaxID=980252 RepID=A0A7V9A7A4_9BACT|nr:SUMF1/EgtB/PvdO family nonheme iron enzyme [Bremerella alba]MBA2115133.1 Serine/threonine-protein kinase PknD [Bremerella alba]
MTELNEKSVFLAAIDIADTRQRATYLNKTCGGDSLFRKRIEALLVEHERSGQFLNVPVLEQLAAGQDSHESEVTITTQGAPGHAEPIDFSFLEPSDEPDSMGKLGHYEIRETIGRGGCGIVLKGFDTKLERIVAIKVMYPELAVTSPARKRFLREARATAAIRHRNVVSIYAVEELPLPYLVMELIDGPTLQQKINALGPLELDDILEIGQYAAAGLAAAHAKGLIHRDIKPANILLEGNTNEVKLTDFGLARSADDASITQSGIISGTPLYMSPEQAQGLEMDERSDLFSLGSVLYVMSSGRPPFRAKTTFAVLRRVVEDQPRPIQQIIPEVPNWLVTIVDVLLAKEPDRRFASAKEVATLLHRCHDDVKHNKAVHLPSEIVRRATTQLPQPTTKQTRTAPRRLALVGGLMALVAILIFALSLEHGQPTKITSQSLDAHTVPSPNAVATQTLPQEAQQPEGVTTKEQSLPSQTASDDQSAITAPLSQRNGKGVWINDGDEFLQGKPEFSELYFGDTAWTDYDVHVEMKTESDDPGSQGGSLYLRAQDRSNRYAFTPGNYFGKGTDLAYTLKGQFHRDDTYAAVQYERNRWYAIDAKVRQDTIQIWLDGQLMFETKNPHFAQGGIGLGTWNSAVRWRNLTVTNPEDKLLWKGFPEGDTKTIADLNKIASGTWQLLLRSQEEFDRVLAASPPLNESEDAYAKYIDGVTELHAKNLYFTDILAKDAIIRAKIRKLEGSWGGFYLRSNEDHIAVYMINSRELQVWLSNGDRHLRLADVHLEDQATDFFEFALATIDETISVFVDGKQVYEKRDDRITRSAGMPALRASHALPRSTFQFKDVEVMVLDPPQTETQQQQLGAIQWACQHGIKVGVIHRGGYITYGPRFLPVEAPSHEIVDLKMADATEIDVAMIENLQHLPEVHRSLIAPAEADDALLLALLRTPGINAVEHFDMRDTNVTDHFLMHMKELPNLRGVCFNNTQVTSEGINLLLPLKNQAIRAANCKNINNQSCEQLASQPRWTFLDLSATSITDEGLKQLLACSQLEFLDVSGCDVSESVVKQLATAIPKLKIVWNGGILDPDAAPTVSFTNLRGMSFALVPHGKAWLGGSDGKPGTQEIVFTEDFYLGTTEVTQEQWHSVMGRNPSFFQKPGPPGTRRSPGADAVQGLTHAEVQKLPVELVSWNEVQQFLTKLNSELNEEGWTYRLPTEQEWEYACRNGPMTSPAESAFSYYFAEGTNRLEMDQANVGNRLARTEKVASYAPNKLGLYDMHGNLYEWCHDTVATNNGELRHPVRGGGYFLGPDQNKTTKRNLDPPDFRNYLSGFRIARVRKSPPKPEVNPTELD